jgi:hypothetical protein
MITFQTSGNIIVTKRSNYPSKKKHPSKKEKEKSSNNNIKAKNIYKNRVNNYFNKSTLSLTSLKLKTIEKKKTQNLRSSQIIKKVTNITSFKNIKINNYLNDKKSFENNSHKINNSNDKANIANSNNLLVNKKTRLNRNINCMSNDCLFFCDANNNDNLSTNYISFNDKRLDLHLYPKPEPMPIKICKNSYFYSNQKCISNRNANINKVFSPEKIINNNDIKNIWNEKDTEYGEDEYRKIPSEKKYYTALKKNFNNNFSKDNKKYKRNSTNLTNNNFKICLDNIDNTNNFENKNKFIREKEKYDEKVVYILKHLDLDNLKNIFHSNFINFNDLFLLTKQDFIEMNIPIGQRNRFLRFLEKYQKFAKNYDFKEVKVFLDLYNNNNLYIDKNTSTLPNKKNNHEIIDNKYNTNEKYKNIDSDSKRIINTNYELDLNSNNELYYNNSTKITKTQESKTVKQSHKKLDIKPKCHKLNINISNFDKNCNLDTNKKYQTFSSVSNSKGASVEVEEFNHKDFTKDNCKISLKKYNKKNCSSSHSNIERDDTTATTTINNKMKSNHFLKGCNNILDEVDNFNTIYSKLKERALYRNKLVSILLSKRNNIEYFRDKIKNNQKAKHKRNNNYYCINNHNHNNKNNNKNNNDCLYQYDLNELKTLREESIRDLNKELKI